MFKPLRTITGHLLDPVLTGTLLWALTRSPEKLRLALISRLYLSPEALAKLISALRWLVALGIGAKINKRLNDISLNSWTLRSQKDKWTWAWEIAVVTGGCSGIGCEVVKNLVKEGVKVAVWDIADLPRELEDNSKISYFRCDVTIPSDIVAAAKATRAELGEPSILINNAGIGAPQLLLDSEPEYAEKIFKVNIISHFWLIKEFMPDMVRKNKGHIVEIGSLASFIAPPGMVDYAATKAAVLALYEGLNQEIKNLYHTPGVLATVVHPGWTRTPILGDNADFIEKSQGSKLLKPQYVAARITEQIFSCRGGQLIVPRSISFVSRLRGEPNWIQEGCRDLAFKDLAKQFPVKSGWVKWVKK